MKINTEVLNSTQSFTVSSNRKLSSYLFGLEKGRAATPHSWLYENETSDETLKRWLVTLDRLKDLPKFGELIYQFDTKQVEKFGPQGKVPPINEALETLESSYTPWDNYHPPLSVLDCKEVAKTIFGRLRCLRPKSPERVVDSMRSRDTLTTNSGWPLFERRSERYVYNASIQDAISGKAYEYPAIILFRQYNGKLRPVWMFPMSVNLIELGYVEVIMEAWRKTTDDIAREYVTPWIGFDEVKRVVTRQWRSGNPFGGDTTAMDAHFRERAGMLVYDVLKWGFQPPYWEGLRRSIAHVFHIEVVVGHNAKLTGPHGIASGSGWTQLLETVYQYIIFWYNARNGSTNGIVPSVGQGIGDDLLWFGGTTSPAGEQERAESLAATLAAWGLPANEAKQSTAVEHTTFLQRLFVDGYASREDSLVLGGIYPTVRALNSLLNPEKYHRPQSWSADMFCLRCYMILENTVDHPLFNEFVSFVVHGQKDLIPFAKKSDAELLKVQQTSREIPGLVPTYNQEKLTKPISSYASIQIAKKM